MAKVQSIPPIPAVPISLKNSLRDFSLNEVMNLVRIYETSGTLPTAPQKVGILAAYYWHNKLYFSPEFWKSLKRCPPPYIPSMWSALSHLATTYYEIMHTEPCSVCDEFQARTGWRYIRSAGPMTRTDKKLMRQYLVNYEGKMITAEKHLKRTNGDTFRLYFEYSPSLTKDLIIVGHCGTHLDNYSTRKLA